LDGADELGRYGLLGLPSNVAWIKGRVAVHVSTSCLIEGPLKFFSPSSPYKPWSLTVFRASFKMGIQSSSWLTAISEAV
jgi:hypothetical protein